MARTVQCIKLGQEAEGLDFPPYPGELGKRIYESVSKQAWADWLKHQTMLVNENRLNLADARARQYLARQMENHFLAVAQTPQQATYRHRRNAVKPMKKGFCKTPSLAAVRRCSRATCHPARNGSAGAPEGLGLAPPLGGNPPSSLALRHGAFLLFYACLRGGVLNCGHNRSFCFPWESEAAAPAQPPPKAQTPIIAQAPRTTEHYCRLESSRDRAPRSAGSPKGQAPA